jgi:hypothetical protein
VLARNKRSIKKKKLQPVGVVVKHAGLWTRRREFESLTGYQHLLLYCRIKIPSYTRWTDSLLMTTAEFFIFAVSLFWVDFGKKSLN